MDWEGEALSFAILSSSRLAGDSAIGVIATGAGTAVTVSDNTVSCGAIAMEVTHVGAAASVAVSGDVIADAHAGILLTVTGLIDDGASLTADNNTVTSSPDVISKKLVGVQISAPAGPMLLTRGALVGARRNIIRHVRAGPTAADTAAHLPRPPPANAGYFRNNPDGGLHVGVEVSATDFVIIGDSALDVSGNSIVRSNAVAVRHAGVAVGTFLQNDAMKTALFQRKSPRHVSKGSFSKWNCHRLRHKLLGAAACYGLPLRAIQ